MEASGRTVLLAVAQGEKKSQSKLHEDIGVVLAPEGRVDCEPDFHLLGR